MEHRITVTIAGLGATADHADRLLEELLAHEPDAGPVVSSNVDEDRVLITVALRSNDAIASVAGAGAIVRLAIARVQFPKTGRIVDVDVEPIDTPVAA